MIIVPLQVHMLHHADNVWLVTEDGRLEIGTPAELGIDVGSADDDPLRALVNRRTR